jgi:hypothetical protein
MSTHTPNKWLVIQMGDVKKVLGGWSGGYLDSDNWRLSSGVKSIEEDGEYYLIHNHSGSVYNCRKGSEGVTSLSSSILEQIKKKCKEDDVEFKVISDEDLLI